MKLILDNDMLTQPLMANILEKVSTLTDHLQNLTRTVKDMYHENVIIKHQQKKIKEDIPLYTKIIEN